MHPACTCCGSRSWSMPVTGLLRNRVRGGATWSSLLVVDLPATCAGCGRLNSLRPNSQRLSAGDVFERMPQFRNRNGLRGVRIRASSWTHGPQVCSSACRQGAYRRRTFGQSPTCTPVETRSGAVRQGLRLTGLRWGCPFSLVRWRSSARTCGTTGGCSRRRRSHRVRASFPARRADPAGTGGTATRSG